MENFLKLGCANPGRSGHSMSVETARKIYLVRDSISELIGSPDPLQIALTCNATYAINIALFSLFKTGDHVITSSMEHNSVMRPLNALNRHGIEYSVAQCSSNGDLDPSDIRKAIKKNTKAIVITHASNILGTIMPIMEISQIAHDMNLKLIVDGAQSAGAVPVDVTDMGIDIFCFSGHKSLYGPQGTGGLFIRKGLEAEMDEVKNHLVHIVPFTINYFKQIKKKYAKGRERKTEIRSFDNIQAAHVAVANEKLYVNRQEGFIGTGMKKEEFVCDCSDIDDIIVIKRDGKYLITKAADKVFVGKDILFVGVW